jgi:hypothetical protein
MPILGLKKNVKNFISLNRYIVLKNKNFTINWDSQKVKLKEYFPNLTNKDLDFEQGQMENMLVKLQIKVGLTRHELYKLITHL